MNKFQQIAVAAVVAIAFTGAAHAQDTTSVVKPLTIKLGGTYITDPNDFGLALGATLDLGKTQAVQPIIYSLYADFTLSYEDTSVFSIGGGAQLRYPLVPIAAPAVPYVGAGIGVYYVDSKRGSGTNFGGKVFAGYEMKKNGYLGEIGYNFTGEHGDNIDFKIGKRF